RGGGSKRAGGGLERERDFNARHACSCRVGGLTQTALQTPVRERAILVGVEWKASGAPTRCAARAEESLEELSELAAGAGAEVVSVAIQAREAPDAATLIGRGKVEELAAEVITGKVDVVIFDHDLT